LVLGIKDKNLFYLLQVKLLTGPDSYREAMIELLLPRYIGTPVK
jgi:hypothetical protein